MPYPLVVAESMPAELRLQWARMHAEAARWYRQRAADYSAYVAIEERNVTREQEQVAALVAEFRAWTRAVMAARAQAAFTEAAHRMREQLDAIHQLLQADAQRLEERRAEEAACRADADYHTALVEELLRRV